LEGGGVGREGKKTEKKKGKKTVFYWGGRGFEKGFLFSIKGGKNWYPEKKQGRGEKVPTLLEDLHTKKEVVNFAKEVGKGKKDSKGKDSGALKGKNPGKEKALEKKIFGGGGSVWGGGGEENSFLKGKKNTRLQESPPDMQNRGGGEGGGAGGGMVFEKKKRGGEVFQEVWKK